MEISDKYGRKYIVDFFNPGNTYLCMDCVDLLKQMPSSSIDLTVTSPPYDGLRTYDGMDFEMFNTISEELYRVTKPGGVIVWVVGDQTIDGSETGTSFRQALRFKDVGFNLHDTMIYQKKNYIPLTHNRYEQSFEYMFILSKGKPKTFNPILISCKNSGKVEKYGQERRRSIDPNQAMRSDLETTYKETKDTKISPNIFTYTCGAEKTGHPAPFPQKLADDMVLSWSNVGDVVFDPFLGSGTTSISCWKSGRQFIGCEINDQYFQILKDRLDPMFSQVRMLDLEPFKEE